MANNSATKTQKDVKKVNIRTVVSFLAVVLAFAAVVIFVMAPAIKIDQSYAFHEQVDAYILDPVANANKEVFFNLKDWCYIISGTAVIFGRGTYDVYTADIKRTPYVIELQKDQMSFNTVMLVGAILAVIVAICYLVMILKKKKHNILNKLVTIGFVAAALIVILSAVWFYAVNPIEESNFYDTVTKLDTGYKYMNAHLAWGPVVSASMLCTSGVLAAFGEY